MCLGGLWLLDGILQLQPAMFTSAFVSTVLSPNLQAQPSIIVSLINFGIRTWNINNFWFNLVSALIQLLIGALLLLPFRDKAHRLGLWISVVWALIIWIFGEGLGNLFTGTATLYTGTPGSALLYLIIAITLLYSGYRKLPTIAGALFVVSAFLNFAPIFWQSGMFVDNFLMIGALLVLGLFLILMPTRSVAWITIVFLLAVWWFSQVFGGLLTFPVGTATDPNSAPLFILFLLPIFF